MIYGYVRKATEKQKIDIQINALKKNGCDKILTEIASGKIEKKVLNKLISNFKAKDTLIVWRLDCLGYPLKLLLNFINELEKKQVHFKSIKEGIDTLVTSGNQSLFYIAAKLIEMESNLIHEKRMVGLELSRERGIKGGRPKVIDRKTFLSALKMYKARKITVGKICEKFNINRRSFYRYLEDNERESN